MQSVESLKSYLTDLIAGRSVAILGFGREGQSTYRTLRHFFPELKLTVLDEATSLPESAAQMLGGDRNSDLVTGPAALTALTNFEVIFKTPGISPYRPEVQAAITKGCKITSQTDAFFHVFGGQVIAVTGTKGKSTTCQILSQVLTLAAREVAFLGNIGSPAFDNLEKINSNSIIIYEISSHQCEGLTVSPHVGVFLNLYQDHLDYYPTLEDYATAKRNLFLHQTAGDYCFANLGDPHVAKLTEGLKSARIGFGFEKTLGTSVYVENDWIISFGEKLMPIAEIPLSGRHNILNVMPAISAAHYLGIEVKKLREYLNQVTPVKGRLEEVGSIDGVSFVDDALATIPEATIAAIDAYGTQLETLITGGFDRGQDFTELGARIARSSLKSVILFPTTGAKIMAAVKAHTDRIKFFDVSDMEEAVKIAKQTTQSGKVVLLSCASASFGLFKDYADRSEQYYRAIHSEGK